MIGRGASARRRRYPIALVGVFGSGNFGNDATLDICLDHVRGPAGGSPVLCVATDPARVAATRGVDAVAFGAGVRGPSRRRVVRVAGRAWSELSGLVRAWRTARDVDVVVIAGTGILDDQHTTSQLAADVLRWSLATRLAGARLVFLSVGAGPLGRRSSRVMSRCALRLAHDVSFRDRASLEYLRGLGRDVSDDRVVPDLVLATMPPAPVAAGTARERRAAIGVLWSGNWADRPAAGRRYEDHLVELVRRLAADGWCVHLLTGDEADVAARAALLDRPELAGLPVAAVELHSFTDVLAEMSRCSVAVVSRYHHLVAALVAGIPVVSLAYGPKNDALLDAFGLAGCGHDIDDFEVDDVLAGLAERDPDEHGRQLRQLGSCRRRITDELRELEGAGRP